MKDPKIQEELSDTLDTQPDTLTERTQTDEQMETQKDTIDATTDAWALRLKSDPTSENDTDQDGKDLSEEREESKEEKEKREENQRDKEKHIRKYKWPDRDNFISMDEYIKALKNIGKKLIERGYREWLVADSLDDHLMTTKGAQQYLNTIEKHDIRTIEGILEALRETDPINEDNNQQDKFGKLRKAAEESHFSFMKRLRKEAKEIWGESEDIREKEREIRRVRKQFFRGSDVPEEISNSLRTCEDLSQVAVIVTEDLKKRAEGYPQELPQELPQQPQQEPQQCCEPPNYHPPRPPNYQPRPNWPPYFHQTEPTYWHQYDNWGQAPFPIQRRENHLSHWQRNRSMPFRQWDQNQWQTRDRPQFQQWGNQQQWDHWQKGPQFQQQHLRPREQRNNFRPEEQNQQGKGQHRPYQQYQHPQQQIIERIEKTPQGSMEPSL